MPSDVFLVRLRYWFTVGGMAMRNACGSTTWRKPLAIGPRPRRSPPRSGPRAPPGSTRARSRRCGSTCTAPGPASRRRRAGSSPPLRRCWNPSTSGRERVTGPPSSEVATTTATPMAGSTTHTRRRAGAPVRSCTRPSATATPAPAASGDHGQDQQPGASAVVGHRGGDRQLAVRDHPEGRRPRWPRRSAAAGGGRRC